MYIILVTDQRFLKEKNIEVTNYLYTSWESFFLQNPTKNKHETNDPEKYFCRFLWSYLAPSQPSVFHVPWIIVNHKL